MVVIMTEIHEKIRLLRNMNQLSQEEMAIKLDMSTNGYAKIERGESNLSIERLNQIAKLFNITLMELMLLGDKNIYIIGDNNTSANNGDNHRHYQNNNQELKHQIETLTIKLQYKDEIIQRLEQENHILKQLVESLKKP